MTMIDTAVANDASRWPQCILVVDDSPAQQCLMGEILVNLSAEALEVDCADSLADARYRLSGRPYDLVLLDHFLGDGHGIDLIRELSGRQSPPIILMTGMPNRKIDLDAIRAGAMDFLNKNDMTPGLLERSIRYAMERHVLAKALIAQQALLESNCRELSAAKTRLEAQGESISLLAAHLASASSHAGLPVDEDELIAKDTIGVCLLHKDGIIASLDDAPRAMLGLTEDPVGKPLLGLFPSQRHKQLREALRLWAGGEPSTCEIEIIGERRQQIALSGSPCKDALGEVLNISITFADVTLRRDAETLAHEMARRDPLTGLINRSALNELLPSTLANAARTERQVAVLYLDLDGFKAVNDTFGHHAGDQLLKTVAQRLLDSVRSSDHVARLGGDEFVIVLTNLKDFTSATQAARKILTRMGIPVDIEGWHIGAKASIGIAMYPEDATEQDQLLRMADEALYRAKNNARGRFEFANPRMSRQTAKRNRWERDLRNAIEANQMELHYQPMVRLDGDDIPCFEALIRWRHPSRGLLAPAQFLPFAESFGLMMPLSRWVLREACRQSAVWREQGHHMGKISVNLSAVQLKEASLFDTISSALSDANLAPSALQVEVTEDAVFEDMRRARDIIGGLKTLGVSIALDDFGTGCSSLSLLSNLSVDHLKIDRSFIRHVEKDQRNAAIVEAVVAIGKRLGIDVVAEGVETIHEAAYLREIGCHHCQGYYFARPMPAADVNNWLRDRKAAESLASPFIARCGSQMLISPEADRSRRPSDPTGIRLGPGA